MTDVFDPSLPTRTLAPGRASAAAAAPARLMPPSGGTLLPSDVGIVVVAALVLVLGIWVRHGAFTEFAEGWNGSWTALAQLTGLLASLTGLAGLLLVARPRVLEHRYGLDRLFDWHRVLGGSMAVLVGAHVVTGLLEWRPTAGGWGAAFFDLTGRESYFALATVGAAFVAIVSVSSLRSIRRRLAYETWYFVHLLAYVGLAVSFGHTIVWGADFADDRLARAVWIGLHVVVIVALLGGRWRSLVTAVFRRRLTLVSRVPLNSDTAALTLTGPALARMSGAAGQFVFVRPMVGRLWWQAHPFSLSAAPTTAGLQLTVKDRGDASGAMIRLPIGTKVIVEGPYGATTPESIAGRRVLFIVGGVGIAPVRALLERLDRTARPVVLYRAHRAEDLVHFDDIQRLATARGGRALALVGPTAKLAVRDPFAPRHLLAAVPDAASRVAVLCGPERLLSAARSGLRAAGVDSADIHFERCWW